MEATDTECRPGVLNRSSRQSPILLMTSTLGPPPSLCQDLCPSRMRCHLPTHRSALRTSSALRCVGQNVTDNVVIYSMDRSVVTTTPVPFFATLEYEFRAQNRFISKIDAGREIMGMVPWNNYRECYTSRPSANQRLTDAPNS